MQWEYGYFAIVEKGVLMRLITPAVASFAVLLSGLGCYSYSESAKEPETSFSLPYNCITDDVRSAVRQELTLRKQRPITREEEAVALLEWRHKTPQFCLPNSFDKELNVVLVSNTSKCGAKTGDNFDDKEKEFKATRLNQPEGCSRLERYTLAIIGTDPSSVDVVEPKTDKTSLTKDMEMKARDIARSRDKSVYMPSDLDISDSPPDIFNVGNISFLFLKFTEEFYDGLPVIILNNNAFNLEGYRANSPFFFSVKEKLYVSCWAQEGCCDYDFYVYNVSGESPKQVYFHSSFYE